MQQCISLGFIPDAKVQWLGTRKAAGTEWGMTEEPPAPGLPCGVTHTTERALDADGQIPPSLQTTASSSPSRPQPGKSSPLGRHSALSVPWSPDGPFAVRSVTSQHRVLKGLTKRTKQERSCNLTGVHSKGPPLRQGP